MNKKYVLSALAVGLAGGLVLGTGQAYAQTPGIYNSTIIERLMQKFGLKEADVKSVFDEERIQRQSLMQARWEERLTQAVKDGKLSEAQKNALAAKHKELAANREKTRADLEAWAKSNNIDLGYLHRAHGMMRHW